MHPYLSHCLPPPHMRTMSPLLALVALSATVFAHDHLVIAQASDLVPWCKAEAEARYVAKNLATYQWTASYRQDGNMLIVDGKLRVHGEDVAVHCRIASGAREDYAVVEIEDATL